MTESQVEIAEVEICFPMHITDGVLPAGTLAAGFLLAGGWIGWTARKLEADDMPRLAVMSAAFFVGSYIHVPLAVTSVHLVLNSLVGIILGVHSVLAIGLGLVFQKLLLGHGGITTIGVNACIMGFPAVLVGWAYRALLKNRPASWRIGGSALLTAVGVALSALVAFFVLVTAGEEFREVAGAFLIGHTPIVVTEAVITGVVIGFLSRVKPELLP
jgi:cobalt/nickel transport system permease protein